MKNHRILSLFLCLCLTFAILLPTLTACNEQVGGEDTSEELTSAESGELTAGQESQQDSESSKAPSETDPETDDTTGSDTTDSDTTEPGSESDTEPGTDTPVGEQTYSLPILRIETADGHDIVDKEKYKTCTITLENCSDPMKFEDVGASIRVRGNSTAGTEKKPFRIKFDKKRNVLGLNDGAKCKSWCLMADYFDYSLMRNSLSFRMSDVLLNGYSFASDCTWVEVYVNGDYRGVYLLCEQTQINPHRVDIYEKADDETSVEIGYLMVGQGGRTDEPNTIQISYGGLPITDLEGTTMGFGGGNFSLSSGDYTKEQIDYCAKVVGNIAYLCSAAIGQNEYYELDENWELVPKTSFNGTTEAEKQIETIAAYVDIESAVRIYMTDEIVKNLDSGTYNMYIDLSPDGAKKLTFGPPWDYDFALANTKYNSTHSPKGLYAANFSYSDGMRVNTWFVMFCQAEWFREMCKPIWMEQRDELFAICENILVDAEVHKDAFDRNFDRWRILGTLNMGYHQADDLYGLETHEDVANFLYNWLNKRLVYLDTVWGDRVIEEPEGNKAFSRIDFTESDRSDLFDGFNNAAGQFKDNSYYRLKVLEPHDPYVHVKYEDNGAQLNADDYSVIEITYRIPTKNALDEYSSEIFLCTGQYAHPTGDVSVRFDLIADGEWHTARIPLPTQYWSGDVHQIRLDFFNGCKRGDEFHLQSIVLTN